MHNIPSVSCQIETSADENELDADENLNHVQHEVYVNHVHSIQSVSFPVSYGRPETILYGI